MASTFITRDALGRPVRVIDALSGETEHAYNGDNQLDALNRRYEIKDARGYITQIGFDANSNTTWVTDSSGNTTNFEFDERNLLTKRTDPNGKEQTNTYNANWQLTSTTDRNGRRRDFAYDENGRVTSEEWYNSSSQLLDTLNYSYDPNSNLLTASNAEGTYTMTYDKVNRPKSSQDIWNKTLNFTHDGNGNRTQVSDSAGGVIDSTYDAANRLTRREFDDGTTELRLDFTYTDDNRIATQTRYSDLAGTTKVASSDYDYDAAGRLTDLTHKDGSDVSFADYDFTYDPGNRPTSETLNSATKTYDYDATNQLTDDDGNPYSYDGTGNRTNTGYTTGTGNRLTSDGTWDYHYDDEGNLTKKTKGANDETWTYGYDNRNQMVWAEQRATDGGTLEMRANYGYDVFGNRIEKEVDNDGDSTIDLTERYAYDGFKPGSGFLGNENWDIWADLDDSSSLTTRYIRGNAIDQLFARVDSAGTAAHYFVDHLGSVRHMTDNSGSLQNEISYNGFGGITSESNPTFGDRYKYTGREWDAETNLQYNRARYYNPEIGRWTSEDPLGFGAGDSNLFRYVTNGPTNGNDPSGLQDDPWAHKGQNNIEARGRAEFGSNWLDAEGRRQFQQEFNRSYNPRIGSDYAWLLDSGEWGRRVLKDMDDGYSLEAAMKRNGQMPSAPVQRQLGGMSFEQRQNLAWQKLIEATEPLFAPIVESGETVTKEFRNAKNATKKLVREMQAKALVALSQEYGNSRPSGTSGIVDTVVGYANYPFFLAGVFIFAHAEQIVDAAFDTSFEILTTFTPGLSQYRDLYELRTGKDLRTGERLSDLGYGLTAAGFGLSLLPIAGVGIGLADEGVGMLAHAARRSRWFQRTRRAGAGNRLLGGRRYPRNSGRFVLEQQFDDCGPVAGCMVLDDLMPPNAPRPFARLAHEAGWRDGIGTQMDELADAMRGYWPHARYVDWSGQSTANKLTQLRNWISEGHPVVLGVRTRGGAHHAIVVDEINQVGRVAIRDPHGAEYWMSMSDFQRHILGRTNEVIVNRPH